MNDSFVWEKINGIIIFIFIFQYSQNFVLRFTTDRLRSRFKFILTVNVRIIKYYSLFTIVSLRRFSMMAQESSNSHKPLEGII